MQLHDITGSATSEASKIEAAYTTYGISKTAPLMASPKQLYANATHHIYTSLFKVIWC